MGCVYSSFLEDEDGIGSAAVGHHIVSLTSTTYGLLTTLDHPLPQTSPAPPPPPPPTPPSSSSRHPPFPLRSEPEVINSWELMAGLDPTTPTKPPLPPPSKCYPITGKENSHRALPFSDPCRRTNILRPSNALAEPADGRYSLDMFEKRCPPGGEHAVVLYTTTLRSIRKTFEDCNAVRAALEGLGVCVREKDVSMDLGFREELRELTAGRGDGPAVPKVFVRGRCIGGAEAVLRIHEEGGLGCLLDGLPRMRASCPCDGCGGVRFLPCFRCNGSRKLVAAAAVAVAEGKKRGGGGKEGEVVRCPDCNENGLMLCPICF